MSDTNPTTPDDDWMDEVIWRIADQSIRIGNRHPRITEEARAAINAKITELLVADRAKQAEVS